MKKEGRDRGIRTNEPCKAGDTADPGHPPSLAKPVIKLKGGFKTGRGALFIQCPINPGNSLPQRVLRRDQPKQGR